MTVQIVQTATRNATGNGGAVLYMSEYRKKFLRKRGLIAASMNPWHLYWQWVRLMMYPFITFAWWLED